MTVPSGIVLPRETDLALREVRPGLYVAVDAYQYDAGYFGQSPLYSSEQRGKELETGTILQPKTEEVVRGGRDLLLRDSDLF
jgi:hypothetical protein